MKFIKNWAPFLILIGIVLVFLLAGLRLVAVVSGSMEPTIPVWSLCVASKRVSYDELELGDVVVYVRRSDGKRIIHRVVEITDEGIVTKGDANSVSDGVSVGPDNIYAKYLFHIPWLGRLTMLYRTKGGIAVIAVVFAAICFLSFGGEKKKPQKPEEPAGETQLPEDK